MPELAGQKILLGVTAGIAAYKVVELARLLVKAGAEVRVVMTPSATHFVGAASFQAVTGHMVVTDLFDEQHEAAMGHIELARWADLVVVAPASADFIARAAVGLANDLLSTLLLATTASVVVVPAMNQQMWRHSATQENIATLVQRGVSIWGPAEGEQACGDTGAGRMLEAKDIYQAITGQLSDGALFDGVNVLITAGPTHEALDPVRFIGNRSSGKMGYAIAQAMRLSGANVTLVSGPVNLTAPAGVELFKVESAQQMHDKVMQHIANQDIMIACAAVADYRPENSARQKIKKNEQSITVNLVPNPDILATVAALDDAPFTLGFAAETNDLEVYAEKKRQAKNVDMIAANLVGVSGQGFDANDNALTVIWGGGKAVLPLQDKRILAQQLIELLSSRYTETRALAK